MQRYSCTICRFEISAEAVPKACPNCGTQKGTWEDLGKDDRIREKFTLIASSSQYIVYKDGGFGRREMKQFFGGLVDSDGDPIYQYCDNDKPILQFTKESDGGFSVCAPNVTKNWFLLGGSRIGPERRRLRRGDSLHLFSSAQSRVVGTLEIE